MCVRDSVGWEDGAAAWHPNTLSRYLLSSIIINRHASHECTDDHDDLNTLRSICHSFKQQAAGRNADQTTNH